MLVHRSYRYRLVLTDEQEARARRFAGCVRALYNAALEQGSLAYRITGRSPSRFAQDRELAELKHAPGLEWIADAPHHSLQQARLDLDRAFVRFFAGGAGYPMPRRKHRNDAFRFPDPRRSASMRAATAGSGCRSSGGAATGSPGRDPSRGGCGP